MKFSFVAQAAILGASVSTGQARRLAEFGASMSMSSEDIVQLASFGESAAFGPGETTASTTSAKAAKPSSNGGKSGKANQPSAAPSVSAMPSVSAAPSGSAKSGKSGPINTSAKAMKLDADATSGKSGKGNDALKETLVSTSLTIPSGKTETERLLLTEGPYELWLECTDDDGPALLVKPKAGFEVINWYGQFVDGPADGSGTYPEGSGYFTLWEPADGANNNPSVGAVAFEGATSKTRWYLGLDGSSFVGTYNDISKTCEYSGIITQGMSLKSSSKGSKEPDMMGSKSSKATTTSTTSTTGATTTLPARM